MRGWRRDGVIQEICGRRDMCTATALQLGSGKAGCTLKSREIGTNIPPCQRADQAHRDWQ